MNMKFIKSTEKRKLLSELNAQFGIDELPFLLIETGKQKIRGFSGTMNKDEIYELSRIANVEVVGTYLVKREHRLRLSLDATQILSKQVSKNIIEIDDRQLEEWMKGNNLDIVKDNSTYVLKHGEDFVGCGISDGKKIINFVPKERRIRRS